MKSLRIPSVDVFGMPLTLILHCCGSEAAKALLVILKEIAQLWERWKGEKNRAGQEDTRHNRDGRSKWWDEKKAIFPPIWPFAKNASIKKKNSPPLYSLSIWRNFPFLQQNISAESLFNTRSLRNALEQHFIIWKMLLRWCECWSYCWRFEGTLLFWLVLVDKLGSFWPSQ